MKNQLTVEELVLISNGELFCGDKSTICSSYMKDTRTIQKGDTYIGITGKSFNGNALYKEAFDKGANCAILEKAYFIKDEEYIYTRPIILVENTIDALKKIATYIRNTTDTICIGVTGSVGKTSTRDMIYSVMKTKYKTLKSDKNYNNHIGVPFTLMRLQDEEAAVIEMGMNALGEIENLSKIVKPNISVITNIGTAHIGNLGSRDNILKAKLEILAGMENDGILLVNNDNDKLHEYYQSNPSRIMTFGIDNESDFKAIDIVLQEHSSKFKIVYLEKEYPIECPVPGKAFIYNSLVAFAVGILTHIEPEKIIKGIQNFTLTENRLEMFTTKENVHIINDCYNASAESMKSSLEILKNCAKKRKIAVLGSMLELGEYSKEMHEQVGKSVVDNSVDILITVGEEAKWIASSAITWNMESQSIYSFDNNKDAIVQLKKIIQSDDTILIKASNRLKFIEIVEALKDSNE